MSNTGSISLLLIMANFIFSYRGFIDTSFFERYKFETDRVLVNREWVRIVSSGFLHVGWTHLILNMFSLLAFSWAVIDVFGFLGFLLIYFGSLVGGNLLSLFIHRHHSDYSAVGASGAVCGIIFASVAVFPGIGVGLLGVYLPGWLYGLAYVLYSIYGIRSAKDNIGHDAHLGGAVIGMLLALALHPIAVMDNYSTILLIFVPAGIFIWLIISKPHFLLVDNLYYKTHRRHYSADHIYNQEKAIRQQEIDRILDKISRTGMKSLTRKEKQKLEEYSKSER